MLSIRFLSKLLFVVLVTAMSTLLASSRFAQKLPTPPETPRGKKSGRGKQQVGQRLAKGGQRVSIPEEVDSRPPEGSSPDVVFAYLNESLKGQFSEVVDVVNKRTVLHALAMRGDFAVAEYLLERVPNERVPNRKKFLSQKDYFKNTPFRLAVMYGRIRIAHLFLSYGALLDDVEPGRSLLHEAILKAENVANRAYAENYLMLCHLLLDAGIDVSLRDNDGKTAGDLVTTLCQEGPDDCLNAMRQMLGNEDVYREISNKNLVAVKSALAQKWPTVVGRLGSLHQAVFVGCCRALQVLLEDGQLSQVPGYADVVTNDEHRRTPLAMAIAFLGNEKLAVDCLIKYGVCISKARMIYLLLMHGANPEHPSVKKVLQGKPGLVPVFAWIRVQQEEVMKRIQRCGDEECAYELLQAQERTEREDLRKRHLAIEKAAQMLAQDRATLEEQETISRRNEAIAASKFYIDVFDDIRSLLGEENRRVAALRCESVACDDASPTLQAGSQQQEQVVSSGHASPIKKVGKTASPVQLRLELPPTSPADIPFSSCSVLLTPGRKSSLGLDMTRDSSGGLKIRFAPRVLEHLQGLAAIDSMEERMALLSVKNPLCETCVMPLDDNIQEVVAARLRRSGVVLNQDKLDHALTTELFIYALLHGSTYIEKRLDDQKTCLLVVASVTRVLSKKLALLSGEQTMPNFITLCFELSASGEVGKCYHFCTQVNHPRDVQVAGKRLYLIEPIPVDCFMADHGRIVLVPDKTKLSGIYGYFERVQSLDGAQ